MKKQLTFKQYIDQVVTKKAKIKFDRETKQWYGVLDHVAGLIYSISKTKAAVKKELSEVLEEFLVLYFKDLGKSNWRTSFVQGINEFAAHKTQRAYR